MVLTGPAQKLLVELRRLGVNITETEMAGALGISVVGQSEAEAGTATDIRFWTAERVAQAVAALESGAGASTTTTNFDGALSSADDTIQKALDTLDDAFAGTASESTEGLVEQATDAEIQASTTGAKGIMAEDLKTAAATESLTDAATIAVDWSAFINGSVTLTADRTLGNPTNEVQMQYRTVLVKGNDGTARTLSFGTEYLGDVPTLDDITSSKWYLVTIACIDTSHFAASAKVVKDA